MKYDAIVIGAGLGGLTAGAVLAKKGKCVLVLEQHSIVGGCATVFHRKGMRCEVGLHEMDFGAYALDMKHCIFEKLGIMNTLPFVKLPQTFTVKTEKKEYSIPEGIENAKKALITYFPEEKDGINKYFNSIQRTAYPVRRLPQDLSFFSFLFYPITSFPITVATWLKQDTVGKKCDEFFTNPIIKQVLNANIVYYHDDPCTLSWFYHSAAQNSYYNSAVFIKGGSQVLSDSLAKIITDSGGKVLVKADVIEIVLEGSKAVGVKWKNSKGIETIEYGKKIIANCAPENIYNGALVPSQFSEPAIEGLKPAVSLYSVYIIFKKAFNTLYPNNSYSTFMRTEKQILEPLSAIKESFENDPIEERDFVFVDYSTIDSGLVTKEGDERSFGVLTGASYLSEWEGLTEEEYKNKKEHLAQVLFDKLEEHYPNCKENIDYYEVSTPRTIKHYIRSPAGTAYGFEQKKYLQKSRAPRKASQIDNLYYVGAWTFPGGGFTGAIISGYILAEDIIMPIKLRLLLRIAYVSAICTGASLFIKQWIL